MDALHPCEAEMTPLRINLVRYQSKRHQCKCALCQCNMSTLPCYTSTHYSYTGTHSPNVDKTQVWPYPSLRKVMSSIHDTLLFLKWSLKSSNWNMNTTQGSLRPSLKAATSGVEHSSCLTVHRNAYMADEIRKWRKLLYPMEPNEQGKFRSADYKIPIWHYDPVLGFTPFLLSQTVPWVLTSKTDLG